MRPEALYWAGFLMADGSISHDKSGKRSPSISFELKESDRESVERFRDFIGSTHKIQECRHLDRRTGLTHRSVRIQVRSTMLVEDLASLGVCGSKQAREKALGEAPMSRDFWRGYMDGDGCYSVTRGYPQMNVVGSLELLEQFRAFMESDGISVRNKISHKPGIRQISIYGMRCAPVCRALYLGAEHFMPRKKAVADQIVAICENILARQEERRVVRESHPPH